MTPDRKTRAQANLRSIAGEAAEGHTVYRLEFSDGAAYVGQTRRALLRRIAGHMLETLSIQSRITAGQSMRVAIVASGLSRQEATRIEAAEIAKIERPINSQLAGGRTVPIPGQAETAAEALQYL